MMDFSIFHYSVTYFPKSFVNSFFIWEEQKTLVCIVNAQITIPQSLGTYSLKSAQLSVWFYEDVSRLLASWKPTNSSVFLISFFFSEIPFHPLHVNIVWLPLPLSANGQRLPHVFLHACRMLITESEVDKEKLTAAKYALPSTAVS